MTEKITLKYTSENYIETEVVVNFPIYRHTSEDRFCIYVKRISKTETITIYDFDDGRIEINIDTNSNMEHDKSSLDYQLGKGAYECTRESFEEIFKYALRLITKF